MDKKFQSFLESSFAVAAYESVPRRMSKKHFKSFGENFEFKGIGDILDDDTYENKILTNHDETDWHGYASYRKDNDCIYNLEVNPKYRGQGYCAKILDLYPNIRYLHVRHDNVPAIHAYEKYGFVKSPIFAYDDFTKRPNYVLMYNKKTVGDTLFRTGADGHVYMNINLPETGWVFYVKAYKIDTTDTGIRTLTPLNDLVTKIKSPDGEAPTCQMHQTKGGNFIYLVLHNVTKDTPLTASLDNVKPYLHEGNNYMKINDKLHIIQESLVLYEDDKGDILSNKITNIHQKLSTLASIKHFIGNKAIDDVSGSLFERLKNLFGIYTKFPFAECKKYFDKYYKEWNKNIDDYLKDSSTEILLGYQKEYTISDADMKKLKPIILDGLSSYYLMEALATYGSFFIRHCDDEEKMYDVIAKEYKKHHEKWTKAEIEFDKFLKKKF